MRPVASWAEIVRAQKMPNAASNKKLIKALFKRFKVPLRKWIELRSGTKSIEPRDSQEECNRKAGGKRKKGKEFLGEAQRKEFRLSDVYKKIWRFVDWGSLCWDETTVSGCGSHTIALWRCAVFRHQRESRDGVLRKAITKRMPSKESVAAKIKSAGRVRPCATRVTMAIAKVAFSRMEAIIRGR